MNEKINKLHRWYNGWRARVECGSPRVRVPVWWNQTIKLIFVFWECWSLCFYDYHWIDTSADGLFVPNGIIHTVVIGSALTWCIMTLSVPDEGYSRNTSSALSSIYTFSWVDTSVDGQLVLREIFCQVVSVSALTWFIRFMNYFSLFCYEKRM